MPQDPVAKSISPLFDIHAIMSTNVLVSVLLVDHGTVMILQRIRGKKNHYLRESGYLE